MPDRTFALLHPLADLQARKMAPAIDSLLTRAALDAAVSGALVARGLPPSVAHMTVEQWRGLGLQVPAEVYAPAHVAEAALTGRAGRTLQTLAATQPWFLQSLAYAPGYERVAMGAAPLAPISPAVGVAPWVGITPALGVQPGIEALGISPFAAISPLGMGMTY